MAYEGDHPQSFAGTLPHLVRVVCLNFMHKNNARMHENQANMPYNQAQMRVGTRTRAATSVTRSGNQMRPR